MTWGAVDDHQDDDERLSGLPLAAYGLYWACLPFCLRRNDRRVSEALVHRITGQHQDGMLDREPEVLVSHGLWEEDPEGGWRYPGDDWDRIAWTEAKRQKKVEAGRLGGVRSAAARQTKYGSSQPASKQPRSTTEYGASKHDGSDSKHSEAVPVPVPGITPLSANADIPPGESADILPLKPKTTDRSAQVREVFDAWVESTGKNPKTTKFDAKRRAKIEARLREGYPVSDLLDAVRGWKHSRHHRGENADGKVWNELTLLLRDGSRVEEFRDLERQRPARVAGSTWD